MNQNNKSALRIALVGAPNSGKTSIFNWLTGSRFKTVNYAGSTTETHRGSTLSFYGEKVEVIDTPGVYSLFPSSKDEEATLETLSSGDLSHVLLVLDATQMSRQLLLALQLKKLEIPFSIALSMVDLLRKRENEIQIKALSEALGVSVFAVDARLGGGLRELVQGVREDAKGRVLIDGLNTTVLTPESTEGLAEKGRKIALAVTQGEVRPKESRLDHWLVHSAFSLPIFFAVMTVLFVSVFFVASPLMDAVDLFFASLSEAVGGFLGEGLFSSFITTGMIEGSGAVLVFVPQILILFIGISFLEESGYLARASTLVDRPLHAVGLSGRSFVPLLSGFACAVPAVMATRNLKSPRERWIAVFILPFMTCSARLPVYALLLAFIFFGEPAWKPGIVLALIYFASAAIGAVAAWALHKILKVKKHSYFLMELPPYRVPRFKTVILDSLRRTKSYVVRVGPTILVFVLILWILTHVPYSPEWDEAEQLRNSFLAQIGVFLEPIFKPMGLDWRVGVALLSAFVAREVFVSAMAVIFNLSGVAEESIQSSLIEQMKLARFDDGSLIFTMPAVVAMIVFFMFALQCISTTGVTIREMGSWKFGLTQLVVMNALAYFFAVVVYQALSLSL